MIESDNYMAVANRDFAHTTIENPAVKIAGGKVYSKGTVSAIGHYGENSVIHLDSGTVENTKGACFLLHGSGAKVFVTGGTLVYGTPLPYGVAGSRR